MSLVVSLLWLLANVLVIPGPPATLTLFYYSSCTAHGEVCDFGDLWREFRRSWGTGWRWGILNIAALLVLVGDVYLTGQLAWSLTTIRYVQGIYFTLAAVWMLVQVYALAFLREQEKTSIRMALRNGAVLLGRNIFFSIVLALIAGLILLAGIPLFMLSAFFGAVFVAGVGCHAVIDRLGIPV